MEISEVANHLEKTNCSLKCFKRQFSQSSFEVESVETDDDKLHIIQERDCLKEMIFSLHCLINKLLQYIGENAKDAKNISFFDTDCEETFYKSIINIDSDQKRLNSTVSCNDSVMRVDVSAIMEEIRNHSLLNSDFNSEINECLKKVAKGASGLLELAQGDHFNIFEWLRNIEYKKNELEQKIQSVEEVQDTMKTEIYMTKNKLALWERHLEARISLFHMFYILLFFLN